MESTRSQSGVMPNPIGTYLTYLGESADGERGSATRRARSTASSPREFGSRSFLLQAEVRTHSMAQFKHSLDAPGVIRLATIAVGALLAACATTQSAASPASGVLAPGSPSLTVPALDDRAAEVPVYLQQAVGDTTARLISRVRITGLAADSGTTLVKDWAPPFQSSDTLLVDARSLRPLHEVLAFNHVRREYRYDGAHVTGIIQYSDSAPRAFDKTFDVPVFAFNEVEPLVRSLDYRAARQVVVPLFSEVDGDVEHDTLSVAGRDKMAGRDMWVVRFADPVITTRYLVDVKTRAILDAVTTQRKSGTRFHYAYFTALTPFDRAHPPVRPASR